ncbi:GDSL esterase/lipase At1g29660 [Linum perenne]
MGRPLNMRPLLIIVGMVFGVVAADGSSRPPPEVPCYFIFGDSLFDSGNNNNLRTLAKVNYPPYGVDFPAGPTGRFTNGRTTADIVGELLGFDKFIPPFASKPNGSELLVGVNYASGSAGILVETGKLTGDNVDLTKQLRHHHETVSNIEKKLGSKKSASDHLAKCLYISNMGNNDYLNNYLLPQSFLMRKKYNPSQFATFIIEKYTQQIKGMYNLGARKIGLVGVAPIGCTPLAIAANASKANNSPCVDSMNQLVEPFNAQLKQLVDRLNVEFTDAKFVYLDSTLTSNLAIQGIYNITFAIDTVPCCKVSTVGCIPNSVPCSNRSEYMFWDAVHPSESANQIGGRVFYEAIKRIL